MKDDVSESDVPFRSDVQVVGPFEDHGFLEVLRFVVLVADAVLADVGDVL